MIWVSVTGKAKYNRNRAENRDKRQQIIAYVSVFRVEKACFRLNRKHKLQYSHKHTSRRGYAEKKNYFIIFHNLPTEYH